MSELEFKRLKMAIIKILRENSTLDRSDINSFSRTVPSFYTLLCKEIYGTYENIGNYYNKARALHRKITANQSFVQEILKYDLSTNIIEENSDNDDYDFVFVSYENVSSKSKSEKSDIKVRKSEKYNFTKLIFNFSSLKRFPN